MESHVSPPGRGSRVAEHGRESMKIATVRLWASTSCGGYFLVLGLCGMPAVTRELVLSGACIGPTPCFENGNYIEHSESLHVLRMVTSAIPMPRRIALNKGNSEVLPKTTDSNGLLEAGLRRRKMQCLCIPMNVDRLLLAQLSEVSANLHPRSRIGRLTRVLKTVEQGYVQSLFDSSRSKVQDRVCRKLYDALSHFRHSFSYRRSTASQWSISRLRSRHS